MSFHFDHDGSSPLRPEVAEAMAAFASGGPPNPTGIHAAARRARAALERARRGAAAFLGLDAADLLFTGSGVEALATGLYGTARSGGRGEGRIVASTGERPEVMEMLEDLGREGYLCERVPLGPDGRIDPEAWARALEGPVLVALLHHANHETGVLQPIGEASRLCSGKGVPFLVDATWSFGRAALPAGAGGAPCDLIALSCHRAGGPAGVGALWAGPGTVLRSLVPGSGERGRRGGVEPVAAAVGMAALAGVLEERGASEEAGIRALRDGMERKIMESISGVERNGSDPRLPGTSNLSFTGLEGEALAVRLDLEGFGVSVGAACSSGSTRPGHVLPAMGLEEDRARASLRISLGWSTGPNEVEALCGLLPGLVEELRTAHPTRTSGGGRA